MGDGSDVIYNYGINDTISLGSSVYYSTTKSGSNYVISAIGSGDITLKSVSSAIIVGGIYTVPATFTDGNDYYSNTTANTILNALAGEDFVLNSAKKVTISGGAGKDVIYNYSVSSGSR